MTDTWGSEDNLLESFLCHVVLSSHVSLVSDFTRWPILLAPDLLMGFLFSLVYSFVTVSLEPRLTCFSLLSARVTDLCRHVLFKESAMVLLVWSRCWCLNQGLPHFGWELTTSSGSIVLNINHQKQEALTSTLCLFIFLMGKRISTELHGEELVYYFDD